jgi:tRNA(Arg) A34 adenosine deaminase TadA
MVVSHAFIAFLMTDQTPSPAPAFSDEDERYMRRALQLAAHARDAENEVPVGAVLVQGDEIIGLGWNRNITLNDPSAHAEIMALRAAGEKLSNYRMPGATLYVTLEPCAMCSMALVHARIGRVVYAATDPKTGAAGSVFDTLISDRHNHRIAVEGGLLADDSSSMLREFFRARR